MGKKDQTKLENMVGPIGYTVNIFQENESNLVRVTRRPVREIVCWLRLVKK
jgi:hypothetical protein